jgi:hypothetical protein
VLLIEEGDLAADDPPVLMDRLAEEVDRRLGELNDEFTNRLETQRLGKTRIIRIVDGSWAKYKEYRLSRSGGTVEQYKQPCLLPDLKAIDQFERIDAINGQ